MLFLVISNPAPTRPSEVREQRKNFWTWAQDKEDCGLVQSVYARTGRGAMAIFNVGSHEILHRLLNEWAEMIPAEFAIHPLMDPEATRAFLSDDGGG